MEVQYTTLQYSDLTQGGTSNKFWRTYTILDPNDTRLFLQYGSKSNGTHGGAFTTLNFLSVGLRDSALVLRLTKKTREGYTRVDSGRFAVIKSEMPPKDEDAARWLASQFVPHQINRLQSADPPVISVKPKPVSKQIDIVANGLIESLNERLLVAITLAAGDPIGGFRALSELRPDIEEAQTQLRKLKDYQDTLEMLAGEGLA